MDTMDSNSNEQNFGPGPETPPTLVAESSNPIPAPVPKPRGRGRPSLSSRLEAGEIIKKPAAKMPVLQPNVSIPSPGVGTRTKSGRIHKPTRNFSSDEYVVPNLVKRRIPNNARPQLQQPPQPTAAVLVLKRRSSGGMTVTVTPPTPPKPAPPPPPPPTAEIEEIKVKLIERFPVVNEGPEHEIPFEFMRDVCFKEHERTEDIKVDDIHARIRNVFKNWTKGPYKLKDDEIKFAQTCIIKPDCRNISALEWRILVEALKDRMFRMRKRFGKVSRLIGKTVKKRMEETMKEAEVGKPGAEVEDTADPDYEPLDEMLDEMENTSSHSSKMSTRSKDRPRGGKNLVNDDFDLSVGGIDDFAGEAIKEEFDDLDSALVNESRTKAGNSNSLVAALHATLQKDGGPPFDPSQFQPPGIEDNEFNLEDMEGVDEDNKFFEIMEEPSFGETAAGGLTDEAFAELEQRVVDDEGSQGLELEDAFQPCSGTSRKHLETERLDLSALEIEESSGNVRVNSSGEQGNLGDTMISTKTALMCALKISEDFLPSSHEKYLERLEESERYPQEELDFIRKKFNMRPSVFAAKRKMKMTVEGVLKKAKVAAAAAAIPPSGKIMNGAEKPKTLPFLRSAYAKCRKFMEDETTVIEKLGDNKISAGGRIFEVQYENYLKESDIEIPYDDTNGTMPKLPPPVSNNCHAPSCRLGCICSSISEDMPPRGHCGRPRCFFECTCQQLLFNNCDDGDIRSRLRPRVSLLNWRAESTEKEKDPITSYRQMERGNHFIRVRRPAVQPERLRREFVLDGKVVERSPTKVTKERIRTKQLLQSSHRRIMAKPAEPHHRFMRIVPTTGPNVEKPKVSIEQMRKKCLPVTIDVEHMDLEITEVFPQPPPPPPQLIRMSLPKRDLLRMAAKQTTKMSAKDLEEMRSIIQEMTEDCQLMALEDRIGFFSWSKGVVHPKVVMYQVALGDEMRVPWLYLPIPPQGYSWICHNLNSSFEKTDYVYIPEIKACISSQALKVNMNTAFVKKKGVMLDVKAEGHPPGLGKIYLFPDLPKILICGPFRTDQTTVNNRDVANADTIATALQHMEKERLMKRFGGDLTWKRFTSAPTIFPIKKRNDNEVTLSREESRRLFKQIYPTIIESAPAAPKMCKPVVNNPERKFDWSHAVKFVGLGNPHNPNPKLPPNITLTELITLNG